MAYDRLKAVEYAHKWAFGRNPSYMDFSKLGGDCTNFISQCLHAGGAPMNYTKTFGWYYSSASNRAPSWTGVAYLYKFLKENKGTGPVGRNIRSEELLPGDIVQLSFERGWFSHSLLVVQGGGKADLDSILIAAHSEDSDYRPLSSYIVEDMRFIGIEYS